MHLSVSHWRFVMFCFIYFEPILWGELLCWKCFSIGKILQKTQITLHYWLGGNALITMSTLSAHICFLTAISHWKELEVFGQMADYRFETKNKGEKGTSCLSECKKVLRKRTQELTWRGSLAKMGHHKHLKNKLPCKG